MTNATPIDDVPIGGEVIRLGQFMKFAGLLDSGGNVKEAIIDGYVSVNGEVDRRRGRQLQLGDVVGFEGRRVRVSASTARADGLQRAFTGGIIIETPDRQRGARSTVELRRTISNGEPVHGLDD